MKTVSFLFAVLSLLVPLQPGISQVIWPPGYPPFIKEVIGDTLVIKTFEEMGGQPDALFQAIYSDTVLVPVGRVYRLQAGGFYPLTRPISRITITSLPTVIVGSDARPLVANKDTLSSPPLICGYVPGWSGSDTMIGTACDLTIRNCELVPAANDGALSWLCTGTNASNLHLLFDNCLFERTRGVFVVTKNANCDVTFRNCYFVNMSGQPCRRNGGVFDCFEPQDSLVVENCTHIMAQGSMYRFRTFPYNRIIINHNTFINCAGSIFMDLGYQSNSSLTNNIFINCSLQAYPRIQSIDSGEQDLDWLPMGLVNVYPDSVDVANGTPRRILVQRNLAYWDPFLNDMETILNNNQVNGVTTWQSQKLIANVRTDSMFRHLGRFNATPYYYLMTDVWLNKMPTFTDPRNLFSTTTGGTLYNVKQFALATVDTGVIGQTAVLPEWRLVNTGPGDFIRSDWPIPVDLSYSDADLKPAGLGGFPLGDLNWFPTQKIAWLAQRTTELAQIDYAMHLHWKGIKDTKGVIPSECDLSQNYPNPFNPTTRISVSIGRVVAPSGVEGPASTIVRLAVYDVLGRAVAVLANGRYVAGEHTFTFDGSRYASGMYIYRLIAGQYSASKRMMLLR